MRHLKSTPHRTLRTKHAYYRLSERRAASHELDRLLGIRSRPDVRATYGLEEAS